MGIRVQQWGPEEILREGAYHKRILIPYDCAGHRGQQGGEESHSQSFSLTTGEECSLLYLPGSNNKGGRQY